MDQMIMIFTKINSHQNLILNFPTKLISNYPNHFNPITTIEFNIKERETGILKIYNVKGQILETKQFESGYHTYIWNPDTHFMSLFLSIKNREFFGS